MLKCRWIIDRAWTFRLSYKLLGNLTTAAAAAAAAAATDDDYDDYDDDDDDATFFGWKTSSYSLLLHVGLGLINETFGLLGQKFYMPFAVFSCPTNNGSVEKKTIWPELRPN